MRKKNKKAREEIEEEGKMRYTVLNILEYFAGFLPVTTTIAAQTHFFLMEERGKQERKTFHKPKVHNKDKLVKVLKQRETKVLQS